jgi:hypothetical protein
MNTIQNSFRIIVMQKLEELSWKCAGCPQLETCEDQTSGGEARYCAPMIEAAILGEDTWRTKHRGE